MAFDAVGHDEVGAGEAAGLWDTQHVYSTDGRQLLRSYGPVRPVIRADGTGPVDVRSRTATIYDTGTEPGHPAGGSRNLPVTVTEDAVASGSPTVTADASGVPAWDGRRRVSVHTYTGGNAWRFGTPTAVAINPGGGAAEVVTRTEVDGQGRTGSRTLPSGGTSVMTAATTT